MKNLRRVTAENEGGIYGDGEGKKENFLYHFGFVQPSNTRPNLTDRHTTPMPTRSTTTGSSLRPRSFTQGKNCEKHK